MFSVRHLVALDGLESLPLSVLFTTDTEYAAGFSHSKFRQVRPGMTAAEVTELLEAPLKIWTNASASTDHWAYSRPARDTDYRARTLVLKDGVVVEVLSELYID